MQIINRNHCYSKTNEIIKKYDVRGTFDNEKTIFRNLSGGNQQKFVLGREMEKNNNLFCIVQPTRGLDIGATNNIHRLIIEQRNKGNSTLLISYDLSEVFKLADNVIVFYKGYATKKLDINSLTYQKIGLLMMGGS
ncbi:MAG: hypothetical protein E7Y34_02875 [Mycoplasma sp.]|nr:hypothetical protein [Mycoplasma sp.]